MPRAMKIAIDSDEFGMQLKETLYNDLRERNLNITDVRFSESHDVNYPDVAFHLAQEVRDGVFDRGILVCGSGLGMAMCANKVEGVFAGTCHDVYTAERLVKSNNAQIITLGSLVVGPESAKMIVNAWLDSEYEGGRSAPKVKRMRELEKTFREL